MADKGMLAVILAGGHGECLRVADEYVPKVLLPVDGKPLLEHQLAWLKRAGFVSAVVSLGYKADAVRARFGDGSALGMRLLYSVEESPRGTAGAVKALGAASLPEDVLVLYGDIYPDTDLAAMLRFHRSHDALATIAVHECGKTHGCEPVVLGPERAIVDFPRQRGPGEPPGWGVSPLWVLRRPLLHFVPDGAASDFLKDVFPAALKSGEPLAAHLEPGRLEDLGSPERYARFRKARGR